MKTFKFARAWISTYDAQKLEVKVEFAETNDVVILRGAHALRAVEIAWNGAKEFSERFMPTHEGMARQVDEYERLFFEMKGKLEEQLQTERDAREMDGQQP